MCVHCTCCPTTELILITCMISRGYPQGKMLAKRFLFLLHSILAALFVAVGSDEMDCEGGRVRMGG